MSITCSDFFVRADRLEKKDRVRLKRSCGALLSEADGQTLTVFYRLMPHFVESFEEDRWFLALCIYCLWDKEDNAGRRPMEKQIAAMKDSSKVSDSFDHRFTGLLDTPWNDDGYLNQKLTRMAKMLKQKGYPVDGAELLDALLHWNDASRRIQKKWVRAYCHTDGGENNENNNQNESED